MKSTTLRLYLTVLKCLGLVEYGTNDSSLPPFFFIRSFHLLMTFLSAPKASIVALSPYWSYSLIIFILCWAISLHEYLLRLESILFTSFKPLILLKIG